MILILGKLDFDNFYEEVILMKSIKNYRNHFSYCSEVVLVYEIYRNKDNHRYRKKRGNRFSGPQLGRLNNDPEILKEQQRQERRDTSIKNSIEGKYGEGKRYYNLFKNNSTPLLVLL